MSAQTFVLIRDFKVGTRYTVRLSVPPGELGEEVAVVVDWSPPRPDLFTRAEVDDLELAHAAVLRELTSMLSWGRVVAVPAPAQMVHSMPATDGTDKGTPTSAEIVTLAPSRKTAAPWVKGQSGNPAGRKSEAAKFRQLIAEPVKKKLVAKLEEMALAGDMAAFRILADRVWPVERAQAPLLNIPGLGAAKTLTEKSGVLVSAMGDGLISSDSVAQLLSVLADAAKIHEVDTLQRQIDELKKQLSLRVV